MTAQPTPPLGLGQETRDESVLRAGRPDYDSEPQGVLGSPDRARIHKKRSLNSINPFTINYLHCAT